MPKYRQKNKKCKNYRTGKEACIELKCSNGTKRSTIQQISRRHFPRNRINEIVVHTKLNNFPGDKMSRSNVSNIRFYEQYYTKDQLSREEDKNIFCIINEGNFSHCNKLKKLYIPGGHLVKNGAFRDCDNLTEVVISKNAQVEEDAFPHHTNIIIE